ncbi:putative transposase [Desulfoluna spongiiphila]|uniref:Putative transposase n=2 Tax=Desulfoluna spongiiphila TaxID=419481 RepID=A0A1G5C5V5_9BACT|nr:putative transposase [Desulfoluna spongiiphila]VVS94130.1 transposase is200-like [Desulfoluna spongiiphila]
MPNYRREKIAGATLFFTVVTHMRRPILCEEPVRKALREGIERVRAVSPFTIDAWVLLPDHLHCIWTLPAGDGDFSLRWAKIKQHVTAACETCFFRDEMMSESRSRRGEGTIWQRRFWEHRIRDDRDFETHMDYIHYNPVKHGVVEVVSTWPWSTYHRYVAQGVYPNDWGGADMPCHAGDFGESG